MNTSSFDYIIIGAGSVGLPAAWYLAKKNVSVLVIDKAPSAGRGQNRAAIGGIRATHSDPAKIKICQKTINIISNLKNETGFDIDWISGGYTYPVYEASREKALKDLLKIQHEYGLNISWISADELSELVPGINRESLLGATFSPEDGSASPLKTADAFYMLAHQAGAEFRFNEQVIGYKTDKGRITAVITDKATYRADTIIDASGAEARLNGQFLGLDIPVYPDSHEAGITEPVAPFFKPMVVDIRPDSCSANYYFYQNAEGQVVFCITPEPKIEGFDCDNTSEFLPLVVKRMLNLYPRLRNLRIRRTWRGLYPMTPDGFPIVSRVNEYSNLFLTVGMCGQGYMIGPGLGQILAEILVDNSNEYNFILKQLTLYRSFTGSEMLK